MMNGRPVTRLLSKWPASRARAGHGNDVDRLAELRQVRHRVGRIGGADKRNQRDSVGLGQVPQHVIGAHLGAGVQGIRENLRQKEDAHGLICLAFALLSSA
jgi:hypothetical protein